jgi:hypothetical protein
MKLILSLAVENNSPKKTTLNKRVVADLRSLPGQFTNKVLMETCLTANLLKIIRP